MVLSIPRTRATQWPVGREGWTEKRGSTPSERTMDSRAARLSSSPAEPTKRTEEERREGSSQRRARQVLRAQPPGRSVLLL